MNQQFSRGRRTSGAGSAPLRSRGPPFLVLLLGWHPTVSTRGPPRLPGFTISKNENFISRTPARGAAPRGRARQNIAD